MNYNYYPFGGPWPYQCTCDLYGSWNCNMHRNDGLYIRPEPMPKVSITYVEPPNLVEEIKQLKEQIKLLTDIVSKLVKDG